MSRADERRAPLGVSISDDDAVAVLSTETGEEVAYLEVGNHPQRVRHGYVPEPVLGGGPMTARKPGLLPSATTLTLRRKVRR